MSKVPLSILYFKQTLKIPSSLEFYLECVLLQLLKVESGAVGRMYYMNKQVVLH